MSLSRNTYYVRVVVSALFHSIRSIVIQPYYYCDSIPALNMSEELTLKCKCGAVECKFDALPRVCFNCQCHTCVAAMKAIEGKEGFDGTSAAVDGGVLGPRRDENERELGGRGTRLVRVRVRVRVRLRLRLKLEVRL